MGLCGRAELRSVAEKGHCRQLLIAVMFTSDAKRCHSSVVAGTVSEDLIHVLNSPTQFQSGQYSTNEVEELACLGKMPSHSVKPRL